MSASDGCQRCRNAPALGFEFSMAFQPIINVHTREIFAYEALVRGTQGEGAGFILAQVDEANRYQFDQACRVKAIELASTLGMQAKLSINFLPNAVYEPKACIRATLAAAEKYAWPLERLIFEITEVEQVRDQGHLARIVNEYRNIGLGTAIDDFGSGYAGLNLLADFQPDLLKLDMQLIRGLHQDAVRHLLVKHLVEIGRALGCQILAEGIETLAEARALYQLGIHLHQGYWYAKPAFEALPEIHPQACAQVQAIS